MTAENPIKTSLKSVEPIIKEYVRQLETEITKLNKQIAKLEIEKTKFKNQNITYKQRVSALQKALDKYESNRGDEINLIIQRPVPPSNINDTTTGLTPTGDSSVG